MGQRSANPATVCYNKRQILVLQHNSHIKEDTLNKGSSKRIQEEIRSPYLLNKEAIIQVIREPILLNNRETHIQAIRECTLLLRY